MMRATLKPCSPSGKAQPSEQVLDVGGIDAGALRPGARTVWAARSSGRTRASSPFLAGVNGDRA